MDTEYIYRAEILSAGSDQDMKRFDELAVLPGYRVVDALHAQLCDLIQTRSPGQQLDNDSLDREIRAFLQSRAEPYGNWIHYPWSQRLVLALERQEFIELRTNRNQLKITLQEQTRLQGKAVGIVGLSVGQSVALTLALERSCGELRLADFDVIDLSNLNRLRCGIHNIGLPKTVVAAREIAELDPYLRVICFDEGYTSANAASFLDGLDLVVDECDSLDVKLELRAAARERGIPVLMNTSDRGMTDIERFDIEPDRAIFHGKLNALRPENLINLTMEEKIPVVIEIADLVNASTRLKASMLEIGQSIKTWPQLASDVTLGGAIICDVGRRVLLGEPVASGRYYFDFSNIGANAEAKPAATETEPFSAADERQKSFVNSESDRLDDLDMIIADAVQAPSAGNLQPWVWSKTNDGLRLRRLQNDGYSALYYEGRAAIVGLGATLESAEISAAHRGFACNIKALSKEDFQMELHLRPGHATDEDRLYPQISRRRSVRTRPRSIEAFPASALERLTAQATRFPGLKLTLLEDRNDIGEVADLIAEAERLCVLDAESYADMMSEIVASRSAHALDGERIPFDSLDLNAAEQSALGLVGDPEVVRHLRDWRLGRGLGFWGRQLIATSSAIGLLWSETDHADSYFAGGRALQRIWLQASALNIGLCPVTRICYLLGVWRHGHRMSGEMQERLPELETRFRSVWGLPETRADIALFRLVPVPENQFDAPRTTLRRPTTA